MCKSEKKGVKAKRGIKYVEEEASTDESDYEYTMTLSLEEGTEEAVNCIRKPGPYQTKLFSDVKVGNATIHFQVDTGATCNVVRLCELPKGHPIRPTTRKLFMYNGTTIEPVGMCTVKLIEPRNNRKYRMECVVAPVSIIGARSAQQMGLIQVPVESVRMAAQVSHGICDRESVIREFPKVFQGDIGRFEGTFHLEVDESARPVQLPVRNTPLTLKGLLKEELDHLENEGIISPVKEPTEWVSSLVVVPKANGKLRVCLDPKPLNKALKRHHYPMPTLDDILPELSRARVFSLADIRNGFWHVCLDEQSRRLTTFGTPYGRYCWNRMPFGIAPAPEVFQMKLQQELEGLSGVYPVADDIFIVGEGTTTTEANVSHDQRMREFLSALSRAEHQAELRTNSDTRCLLFHT